MFVPPGTAFSGGQAMFARSLADEICHYYRLTVITLHYSNHRAAYQSDNYIVLEVPVVGSNFDAFTLFRMFPSVEAQARQTLLTSSPSYRLLISVYWLSGLFILRQQRFPSTWIHSYSSYAVQKAQEESYSGKNDYLESRAKSELAIAKQATIIWVANKYEEELIIDSFGIPPSKCRKISRGIGLHKLPEGKKVHRWDIAYIGRLDPAKGIYDIPKILEFIDTPMNIAIIGGASSESAAYYDWFRRHHVSILRRHCVDFIPAVKHNRVTSLMSEAKVVLVPSHYETFGNVVQEALACCTPVVGTAVGGIPELIEHGITGLVFPPGDFERAAVQLKSVVNNENMRLQMVSVLLSKRNTWPTWQKTIKELSAIIS